MNIHERRAIKSYDRIAANYDDSAEGRFTFPFNRRLVEVVRIPEGGRLLDVACGNGRLLAMFRQAHLFQGYGVDISPQMVRVAQHGLPDMTFRVAPADNLPFDDGFFDVLTVCMGFHHFPDAGAFAREAHRVLTPGGRLYIAELYYFRLMRTIVNPLIGLHPSGDVKLYGPDEIEKLLTANGFVCEPTLVEGKLQIVTAVK